MATTMRAAVFGGTKSVGGVEKTGGGRPVGDMLQVKASRGRPINGRRIEGVGEIDQVSFIEQNLPFGQGLVLLAAGCGQEDDAREHSAAKIHK